jgi:hypothetical protein
VQGLKLGSKFLRFHLPNIARQVNFDISIYFWYHLGCCLYFFDCWSQVILAIFHCFFGFNHWNYTVKNQIHWNLMNIRNFEGHLFSKNSIAFFYFVSFSYTKFETSSHFLHVHIIFHIFLDYFWNQVVF